MTASCHSKSCISISSISSWNRDSSSAEAFCPIEPPREQQEHRSKRRNSSKTGNSSKRMAATTGTTHRQQKQRSCLGPRISIALNRRGARMLLDLSQEPLGLPQACVLTPLEDTPSICFGDFALNFSMVFGQYAYKNIWFGTKHA